MLFFRLIQGTHPARVSKHKNSLLFIPNFHIFMQTILYFLHCNINI
jgi:hypothetical protein